MTLFLDNKKAALNSLDLSRKGSIDIKIQTIVKNINDSSNYFTSSSCSGRIVIYSAPDDGSIKKKGCNWLHVSHDSINLEDTISALHSHDGMAVMKYESFILHVRCDCLESAKTLHAASLESGFKNSGITVGKKGRITLAVRSSHNMEVPLSQNGVLLVNEKYLEFLVQQMNQKLNENFCRIERFEKNFSLLSQESTIKNVTAHKKNSDYKLSKKGFNQDHISNNFDDKNSYWQKPKTDCIGHSSVIHEDEQLTMLFENT